MKNKNKNTYNRECSIYFYIHSSYRNLGYAIISICNRMVCSTINDHFWMSV